MIRFRKEHFVLTIADIIFLSLFFYFSFAAGRELLLDADTGHHIRAGEYILKTGSIPKTDIFSFITPALPWTAHGWLSEVIMALVHRSFGLTGIVIFFAAMISAVYFLLFRALRSASGNIILTAIAVLLAIGVSQLHWFARPHIFSHVLFIVWYFLLNSYQNRNARDAQRTTPFGSGRLLLFLPILMLLWVNLHGGFIMGFVLLGIFITGNLIRRMPLAGPDQENATEKIKGLITATALCLLAAMLNPTGWRIFLFPFHVISDSYMMDHVREYLSPDFHVSVHVPFKLLLLLTIAIFGLSRKKSSAVEILLVVVFAHISLYSARHIPLFVFVTAPILLRHAESMLGERTGRFALAFRQKASDIAAVDSAATGYVWMGVGMLAVVICAAHGTPNYRFDPNLKPVDAVEFLKREPIPGNMFNDDEFGDYIIYAAWPGYRVFSDGRSDMYGPERMKEYFRVKSFAPGWEKVIDRYNIGWVIEESKSALARYLLRDDGWRLIYADPVAGIFVRNTPEYQYLIDKYRNVHPVNTADAATGTHPG